MIYDDYNRYKTLITIDIGVEPDDDYNSYKTLITIAIGADRDDDQSSKILITIALRTEW